MTYIVPKKVYYIHIPKSGGTTEKYKLKQMFGEDLIEVPTGKHSPYDEQYADYDCIYTHVRNPHNRLLSLYLFCHELDFMPKKFISKERDEFLNTEHRLKIHLNATKYIAEQSQFDKVMLHKLKQFHSTSPLYFTMSNYSISMINAIRDFGKKVDFTIHWIRTE